MHVHTLLDRLKSRFGEPVLPSDRDETYHWQIHVPGAPEIHLCLTVEEQTRRASIWLFNPSLDESASYLHVHDDNGVIEAMEFLHQSVPNHVAQMQR